MGLWSRVCDKGEPALRAATLVIIALVTGYPAAAAETTGRVYKVGFLGQTSAADHSRQTARYDKVSAI